MKKVREKIKKLIDEFSKLKIKKIRRNLYEIKKQKNISALKMKEIEKNLLEIEKNLFKPKKY